MMTDPPQTLNEIIARLDLTRERIENAKDLADRRWYVRNYRNNLALLRDRLGEAGVLKYAHYAVWYALNTDVEERR